jgi:hypothetical protein
MIKESLRRHASNSPRDPAAPLTACPAMDRLRAAVRRRPLPSNSAGTPAGDRRLPHNGPAVRLEASPEVLSSCKHRRRRRLGRFWRFTYTPVPQPQDRFPHCIEKMDSHIEKMDSCIEKMDSRIEKMDSRIEKMDSPIEKMDSRIEKMDSRIEKMDSQ